VNPSLAARWCWCIFGTNFNRRLAQGEGVRSLVYNVDAALGGIIGHCECTYLQGAVLCCVAAAMWRRYTAASTARGLFTNLLLRSSPPHLRSCAPTAFDWPALTAFLRQTLEHHRPIGCQRPTCLGVSKQPCSRARRLTFGRRTTCNDPHSSNLGNKAGGLKCRLSLLAANGMVGTD